ncbi:MAG: MATE family efflux transporter [Acidimicrobiales bacterium]
MATGEHDREILRLALPAFAALIAEPLYVLADTAVVGHIGTPELAGLAVASSALLTGYAMFIFLAYGTTAAVARLLGAGDERAAAHQAVQGLWLALVVSVPLVVAGVAGAGEAVRALGATGAVATNAEVYLRISIAGVPALLLGLAGIGYLRGRRDTLTPLLVALGTNVANLGLELVLINRYGYGIGASALATVIAQWIGAAVYVRRVLVPVRALGVSLLPDPSALRVLGRTSIDLLLRTAALRAAYTGATAVAARIGPAEVAAHEVALSIFLFLALALDAIAIAGQALVAGALGAGTAERARSLCRRMVRLGLYAGMAFGFGIVALRPVLPHVFTTDRRVVVLAGFLLWFVAALQPLNAVVSVLDGVLIGAGDGRYLAAAMAAATTVFVAGAAVVVVVDLGIGWLWTTFAAFMGARAASLWLRYRSDAWLVATPAR